MHCQSFEGFKTDLMAALGRRGFQCSSPSGKLELEVSKVCEEDTRAKLVL